MENTPIDLSSNRPHSGFDPDDSVLLVSGSGAVHRGGYRPRRSYHRQGARSLLGIIFGLLLVAAFPLASAFADIAHTYTFPTDVQGWTVANGAWSADTGGVCSAANNLTHGCIHDGTQGTTLTATSPTLVAGSGITGLTVSSVVYGQSLSGSQAVFSWGGSAQSTVALSCSGGTNGGTCTATSGSSPAAGTSYTVQLQLVLAGCCGAASSIDSVVVTESGAVAPCVGSCISYPTISLTTVSSQMSAFFAYLAPVLYVVGGIGLGGLIIGKARGLF